MKLVKTGMALLLAFATLNIQAQTADEIVNKYVNAIGGKDKLAKIKTIHMENTSMAMGNEGPSTINVVDGVGYKLESSYNGQSIIMCLNKNGGWQINPFAGATTATALPADAFKQSRSKLSATTPLVDYVAKGNKVELLGKEGNDYKLKVTSSDSTVSTIYVDGTTYYITKIIVPSEFMGQSMDIISTFSNYKKGDMDIFFPYAIDISYGGQFSVTTTVNKIELNKNIDPAIFEMPKS